MKGRKRGLREPLEKSHCDKAGEGCSGLGQVRKGGKSLGINLYLYLYIYALELHASGINLCLAWTLKMMDLQGMIETDICSIVATPLVPLGTIFLLLYQLQMRYFQSYMILSILHNICSLFLNFSEQLSPKWMSLL